MAWGMMAPPPQEEEYDMTVMGGAMPPGPPGGPLPPPMDIGGIAPSGSMPWSEQLKSASSTPQEQEGGNLSQILKMAQEAQGGGESSYYSGLAPLLAGAAAVFGGSSSNPAIQNIFGGLAKGYATHLTDEARAKREMKMKGDSSTVDLAHKYLGELPGDVDEGKYPGLAEMGRNMREKLTTGSLSSPKEAMEFILEYTKYKNDIDDLQKDRERADAKAKAMLPYQALQESFTNAGLPQAASLSALLDKAGIMEDPQNPGRYIDPSVNTAREATVRAGNTAGAADARAERDRVQRASDAQAGREAANNRFNTAEKGRNRRFDERKKDTGASTKGYQAVLHKATQYALQRGRTALPSEAAAKQEEWKHDYLIEAGEDHKPLTGTVKGKTVYYIGNGKWDYAPVGGGSALTLNAPPSSEDGNEDSYEGE